MRTKDDDDDKVFIKCTISMRTNDDDDDDKVFIKCPISSVSLWKDADG